MTDKQNSENEEAKSCACDGLWRQDRLDAVGWGIFFIGVGVMILIGTVIRCLLPRYRSKWMTSLILGLMMLAVGFGASGWDIWNWVWVVILAFIGISIFIRAFAHHR